MFNQASESTGLFDLPATNLLDSGTYDPAVGKAQLLNAQRTMEAYIEVLRNSVECTYCKGWGHHARNCSTLRVINRMAKTSKTLKGAWGFMKGAALKKRILKATTKGAAGRKRQRVN